MKQLSDFEVGHLYWDKTNPSLLLECYIFDGINFLTVTSDDFIDTMQKPMRYEGDISNLIEVDSNLIEVDAIRAL